MQDIVPVLERIHQALDIKSRLDTVVDEGDFSKVTFQTEPRNYFLGLYKLILDPWLVRANITVTPGNVINAFEKCSAAFYLK